MYSVYVQSLLYKVHFEPTNDLSTHFPKNYFHLTLVKSGTYSIVTYLTSMRVTKFKSFFSCFRTLWNAFSVEVLDKRQK